MKIALILFIAVLCISLITLCICFIAPSTTAIIEKPLPSTTVSPISPRRTKYVHGLCKPSDDYIQPLVVKGIISSQLANSIVEAAENKGFEMSKVDLNTVDKAQRVSDVCWLYKVEGYPWYNELASIWSRFCKLDKKHMQPIQVCRYDPGGHFGWHYDQCEDHKAQCINMTKELGYRFCNILISLNSGYEGGGTEFAAYDFTYRGDIGDGIVFHMLNKKGTQAHPHSLHRGRPVTKGRKYIANIWARLKNEVVE